VADDASGTCHCGRAFFESGRMASGTTFLTRATAGGWLPLESHVQGSGRGKFVFFQATASRHNLILKSV